MDRDDVARWFAETDRDEAAKCLAEILPAFVGPEFFRLWEEHGFHLTASDFLSPIPHVGGLKDSLFTTPSAMAGIDLNEAEQLRLLREVFPTFAEEYNAFPEKESEEPHGFYFDNPFFSGTDALVCYCMVRHLQPKELLEVGSGFSTRLSAAALKLNGRGRLRCIEPYPSDFLVKGFPGLDRLYREKVEDVGLDIFTELDAGDVLFIDSSHVCRIGGDVNFLYLEVLPRLKPGVIVHVHDIFLPFEYKREWVLDDHLFWSEQYLLQAFLACNDDFEILFGNTYMAHTYPDDMKSTFPTSPWYGGGTFWMRRKPAAD